MSARHTHIGVVDDEEEGSPSRPAAPTSPYSHHYVSPSAKIVMEANRWGFPMSFDLRRETTTTHLATGEYIVAEYRWNAHVLSFKEWLLCFATLGYYYFLTRCVIRRNHRYSVLVTNLRVMTKEEFYQIKGCGWVYVEKAVENQTSFKLAELSYIMSEKRGATLLGWKPSIVNLEIHFGEYPISPSSSGIRRVSDVIDQINATNDTLNQLLGYAQDFSSIAWDYLKWLWEMTKEIILTPAETSGEANRNGDGNAQILSISVELVQDPEAFEQLQKIVQAIIDHLPTRNFAADVTPEEDLRPSLIHVDQTTAVNAGNGATYGSDKTGAFTVNTHLLYLHPSERVKDVCPNNYMFTCQHLLYMYATLGLYYVMLWDLVTYSTSFMVTDRRLVKHSLRLSIVDHKVLHHRLDMWFPDEADGSYVVNQGNDVRGCAKGTTELSVETDKKGTLNIVLNSYEFALKLAGHLTATLPRRGEHVSVLPQETYQSARMTRRGLLTKLALLPDEHVDACENAYLRNSACCNALTCGLRKVLKTTLTTTDRGVYVESYQQNSKGFYGRTLVFYAWKQVWGAYWENSYFKKSQCLDCNCAYSYFNLCYWYKPNPIRSCHLRINVEGKTTFEFGIEMFDRVYGVQRGDAMERGDTTEPLTAVDCETAGNAPFPAHSGAADKDEMYTMGKIKSAKIKTTRRSTQVDALVDSMALGITTSGGDA